MAAGQTITQFTQVAPAASNGCYIVQADMRANSIQAIKQIQAFNSTGSLYSSVVPTPVDDSILYGYLLSASPPDLAFSVNGNVLDILLNGNKYPYLDTIYLIVRYWRTPIILVSLASYLDIPPEARALMKGLILKNLTSDSGLVPTLEATNLINRQKKLLGLT